MYVLVTYVFIYVCMHTVRNEIPA